MATLRELPASERINTVRALIALAFDASRSLKSSSQNGYNEIFRQFPQHAELHDLVRSCLGNEMKQEPVSRRLWRTFQRSDREVILFSCPELIEINRDEMQASLDAIGLREYLLINIEAPLPQKAAKLAKKQSKKESKPEKRDNKGEIETRILDVMNQPKTATEIWAETGITKGILIPRLLALETRGLVQIFKNEQPHRYQIIPNDKHALSEKKPSPDTAERTSTSSSPSTIKKHTVRTKGQRTVTPPEESSAIESEPTLERDAYTSSALEAAQPSFPNARRRYSRETMRTMILTECSRRDCSILEVVSLFTGIEQERAVRLVESLVTENLLTQANDGSYRRKAK